MIYIFVFLMTDRAMQSTLGPAQQDGTLRDSCLNAFDSDLVQLLPCALFWDKAGPL
jgi:hypothetical protein